MPTGSDAQRRGTPAHNPKWTLGCPIRGGDADDWPPGSGGRHAEIEAGDGPTVEFDNEAGVKLWHAGWHEPGEGARAVIGFSLPSREAVDELYAKGDRRRRPKQAAAL